MKFGHVKLGDTIKRRMGAGGPLMTLIVVKIDDDLIYCDHETRPMKDRPLDELWKFDRVTGAEEDAHLSWGRGYGRTGTYLEEDSDDDLASDNG